MVVRRRQAAPAPPAARARAQPAPGRAADVRLVGAGLLRGDRARAGPHGDRQWTVVAVVAVLRPGAAAGHPRPAGATPAAPPRAGESLPTDSPGPHRADAGGREVARRASPPVRAGRRDCANFHDLAARASRLRRSTRQRRRRSRRTARPHENPEPTERASTPASAPSIHVVRARKLLLGGLVGGGRRARCSCLVGFGIGMRPARPHLGRAGRGDGAVLLQRRPAASWCCSPTPAPGPCCRSRWPATRLGWWCSGSCCCSTARTHDAWPSLTPMVVFVTTIAVVAGWLVVEVFVFSRLRIGVYDTEYVSAVHRGIRSRDRAPQSTASVCSRHDGHGKCSEDQAESQGARNQTAMNQGMRVLSYLISGVLLYGCLGWLGDHFLHTRFLLPVGIVLGAGVRDLHASIRRFGRSTPRLPSRWAATTRSRRRRRWCADDDGGRPVSGLLGSDAAGGLRATRRPQLRPPADLPGVAVVRQVHPAGHRLGDLDHGLLGDHGAQDTRWCPSKGQFIGETAYFFVRNSIARDISATTSEATCRC